LSSYSLSSQLITLWHLSLGFEHKEFLKGDRHLLDVGSEADNICC